MLTATDEITNAQDIIDSRDVIARIEELAEPEEASKRIAELEEADELSDEEAAELAELRAGDELDDDQAEELRMLRELAEEASGYAEDWPHGETLIRDSYFEEYAEQLADDLGAISREATWPLNHIDWKAAADELKIDYTSVDFGGVTYWIR